MKKALVLGLGALLVIGSVLVAYAAATRVTFNVYAGYTEATTGNESGFAIVNDNKGKDKTIIQVQVRGLATVLNDGVTPATYYVYMWRPGPVCTNLGEIKLNKSGNGHCHIVVSPTIVPRGCVLGISNVPAPPSSAYVILSKVVPL